MRTFFSSFANSAAVVLIVGLLAMTFLQADFNKTLRAEIVQLQDKVENDSIFYYLPVQDSIIGDTLLAITNQAIVNAVVGINKEIIPVHKELVRFANWSIPIIDTYVEKAKPKDEDNVLCSTWEDWKIDQKAIAVEKQANN